MNSQIYPAQSRVWIIPAIAVLLVVCFLAPSTRAQTSICGTLNAAEEYHWTSAGSPYTFCGNVTVPAREPFSDWGIDGIANTDDAGEGNGAYDSGEPYTDYNENESYDDSLTLRVDSGAEIDLSNKFLYVDGSLHMDGAAVSGSGDIRLYATSIDNYIRNSTISSSIYVYSTDSTELSTSDLAHVRVQAGAGTVQIVNNVNVSLIQLYDGGTATVTVTGNTISDRLSVTSGSAPSVSGNTFTSDQPYQFNAGIDTSGIIGNTYDQEVIWIAVLPTTLFEI